MPSRQQLKQLQLALINAFPSKSSLERLLYFELEKNLKEITRDSDLQEITFKLIQTAEAEGWVEDLVRAARQSNPGNPLLKAIGEGLLTNHSETSSIPFTNIFSEPEKVNDFNILSFKRVIEDPSVLVGYRLEPYVLQDPIGAGGSGLVYRAWNSNLDQQVCIKIFYPLKSDLTSIVATIARGVRAIAKLNHYNIIKIFDFSPFELEDKASFFIVMEWVDGKTLDDWSHELPDSHQSLVERLKMAFKIAMALKDAHNCKYIGEVGFEQTGVLHGDIKPANIMVRIDNSPVLIDFMMIDIQRLIDPKVVPFYFLNRSAMTMICGTPGFMAPEQEQKGIVTTKTDIYSLGVIFFYLFFPEDPVRELWRQETNDQLHNLKSLLREMKDPNPEKRPQDMKVVVERIAEIAAKMGVNLSNSLSSEAPPELTPKWTKQQKMWMSFVVVAIIAPSSIFLGKWFNSSNKPTIPLSLTTPTPTPTALTEIFKAETKKQEQLQKQISTLSGQKRKISSFLHLSQSVSEHVEWQLIAYDSNYSNPTFYDKNSVSHSGDVVILRVKISNTVRFLELSCSHDIYGVSIDGKRFGSLQPIAPHSPVAKLHEMFCH